MTTNRLVDMAGQRVGRLTVLDRASSRRGRATWVCRCDCGATVEVGGTSLRRSNATRSCGCLSVELASTHRESPAVSGGSAEYRAWSCMKTRCLNPSRPSYKNYGARGITVCARWRDSFENFLADMGRKPTARHSLDRIDNNKGYEPGNCRWATRCEQAANTRRSVLEAHEPAQIVWLVSLGYSTRKIGEFFGIPTERAWRVNRDFLRREGGQ